MKSVIALFSLLFFTLAANGESQVIATVDRNQVGMGDVINLTVQISADNSAQVEPPKLPPLSGLEVINTSSAMETRHAFVNGQFKSTQTMNFVYMLVVQQKGILEIPAIPVSFDGKTVKTQPIKISATAARPDAQNRQQAQRGQGGGGPFEEMDEMEELFNQMLQRRVMPRGAPGGQNGQVTPPANPEEAFFISAEADKNRVYVGEQVTVGFYLYTRGQIRDIDTLKYPDLKGFWKEELEMATRLNFEQVVLNGIVYQKALLVSYALFPIKAGKAVIDAYKAKCTVITPSNFGFGRPYQFTKASRPLPIEVEEIPVQGRPPNYAGAVGHFRVSAQFEPPTGSVNQPVTLRVRFEGQGNAKLIELPKLDLPASFELYDQKNSSKFMKDGTSYKEFEVLIIPREPGVFNIPAVNTAMFDPQTKKFTNIASQALNISITGSATTPAPAIPQAGNKGAAPAPQPQDELPALSGEMESFSVSARALSGITVLVYLAAFGALGYRGFRSFRRKPKRVSLALVLKRRLKRVREVAAKGDYRKVGVELTNALYYMLGQISERGGANLELNLLLEFTPPSLREELSEKIRTLASKCESLSFAPEKMITDLTEKSKLEALVQEFETVMNRAIVLAEF